MSKKPQEEKKASSMNPVHKDIVHTEALKKESKYEGVNVMKEF